MEFCSKEPKESGVSECTADIIVSLVPSVFITAVLPCCLIKWWRIRGDHRRKRLWVRFPGHTVRWLTTVALLYFQILEFTEGIISGLHWNRMYYLQLYIPSFVSILCSVLTLVFHDLSESFNLPKLMSLSFGYWISTFLAKCVKLSALYDNDLAIDTARVTLTWITTVFTSVLVLVELYALRYQVRPYLCSTLHAWTLKHFSSDNLTHKMPKLYTNCAFIAVTLRFNISIRKQFYFVH